MAAGDGAGTDHRHQRHDPRAAREQEERPAERLFPDEVAADRPAQLELVPGPQLADEIGRHLPVVEPLDGEHEVLVLGRRGDRVAALGLVAVLGSESHVDVLSGPMAGPRRRLEHEAACLWRLLDQLDNARELPAQSPWYRCSCHGSP